MIVCILLLIAVGVGCWLAWLPYEARVVIWALEEMEEQRGPVASLALAMHILGGGKWWET